MLNLRAPEEAPGEEDGGTGGIWRFL